MKKTLLLALCLGTLLITSCKKSTRCQCEEYSATSTIDFFEADPESWGATNCGDLQIKLRQVALQEGYNHGFRCSEK